MAPTGPTHSLGHVRTVVAPSLQRGGSAGGALRRWMVLIVVLALLIRVLVVLGSAHFTALTDAADYDTDAVSLVTHHSFPTSLFGGPSAFRPPAFPIFLAGVYAVSGTASPSVRWRAGRLAEAGLGAVAVALIGLIAVELFSLAVGLAAAAMAAVYPPLVLVGSSLMSESLFLPLVLGAVLLALRARRRGGESWRTLAACGVLVGLAGLTRTVGLVLILPLLGLIIIRPFRSRGNLVRGGALVLATVATLAPWGIRNYNAFHSFVPVSTEGGFALVGTYNAVARNRPDFPGLWTFPGTQLVGLLHRPHVSEAKASAELTHAGERYMTANPGYVAEVIGLSALRMLAPGPALARFEARYVGYSRRLAVLSVYSFWLVGALGALALLRRVWRGTPLAVWGVPVAFFTVACVFCGTQRYRSPIDPFVLILVAALLVPTTERLIGPVVARASRWRGRADPELPSRLA